jgi:hypothetical protein
MNNQNLLSSKLYVSEASESKEKTKKELDIPDPENIDVESLLESHAVTVEHKDK